MLQLYLLPLLWLNWVPHSRAVSAVEILAETPACVYDCIIDSFTTAACDLGDVTSCICANITLQAELSVCAQTDCSFADQLTAAAVEGELCIAYPKASRSWVVKRTIIVGSAVVFPIIALRLFSRLKYAKRLWMDDYVTILGMILLATYATIHLYVANTGFGMHYWTIPVGNGTTILKLLYAGSLVYAVLQAIGRLSIVLFFTRIFPSPLFKKMANSLSILLLIHGTTLVVLNAVQCLPVHSIWDRNITDRKCLDLPAVGYSSSALAIVEDIVILILPIPQVWRLQISLRRRLALLGLFSIGSFACLTSMIRIKYLVQYSITFDVTWDYIDIVTWSVIEQISAMLCASLPAVRLLLVHIAKKIWPCRKPSQDQEVCRTSTSIASFSCLGRLKEQAMRLARNSANQIKRFSQQDSNQGGIWVTRTFEVSRSGPDTGLRSLTPSITDIPPSPGVRLISPSQQRSMTL